MSYRHILDDAIGVAPKTTVDVDAVVSRQRRYIRHTRAARLAAAALVLLGVTGAAVFNPFAIRVNGMRAGGTEISPSSTQEDRAARRERLTAAMRAAVLVAAPTAVLGGPFTQDGSDGADAFVAREHIRVDDHEGQVAIWLVPPQSESCQDLDPRSPGLASCVETTGPGGERVVAWSEARSLFVCVTRTVVHSVCVTLGYDRKPPLTVDQLQAIALYPALTLYR